MAKKTVNKTMVRKMVSLSKKGLTQSQIAKEVGVSRSTVQRHLQKFPTKEEAPKKKTKKVKKCKEKSSTLNHTCCKENTTKEQTLFDKWTVFWALTGTAVGASLYFLL